MRGRGSKVQWREALVVGLADIGAIIDQLAYDGVLAVEARQVESRVPEGVGLIYLWSKGGGSQDCHIHTREAWQLGKTCEDEEDDGSFLH